MVYNHLIHCKVRLNVMCLLPALVTEPLAQVLCDVTRCLDSAVVRALGVDSVAAQDSLEHAANTIPGTFSMAWAPEAPGNGHSHFITDAR